MKIGGLIGSWKNTEKIEKTNELILQALVLIEEELHEIKTHLVKK